MSVVSANIQAGATTRSYRDYVSRPWSHELPHPEKRSNLDVIAVAARDAGFEVIYAGIRLEPAAIAATAVQESVDIVGLSVLSGSHLELTGAVLASLRERGAGDVPVVVGGVVPAADHAALQALGVKRVFTPSDYRLTDVVGALIALVSDGGSP